MDSEFQALQFNHTWELVPSTTAHNIVDTKWVYKIKRDVDDNIQWYKARLVARGYLQEPRVDYGETYSY